MGHKRYGWMPKTEIWRKIVAEMGQYALGRSEISFIARNTLQNVEDRFFNLRNDPSIRSSFEFLLQVAYAFRQEKPLKYLTDKKIIEKEEISLLKLGRAAFNYNKEGELASHEYQTFARQAAIDAINNWYNNNAERGRTLFDNEVDTVAVFRKVGNGSGFCELSRLYFSKLTERYLKYFLERNASAKITNVNTRKEFSSEIEKHVYDISQHAFDTAKITQSYSAGWYNKHAVDDFPEKDKINGFLSYALDKMQSELLVEKGK